MKITPSDTDLRNLSFNLTKFLYVYLENYIMEWLGKLLICFLLLNAFYKTIKLAKAAKCHCFPIKRRKARLTEY